MAVSPAATGSYRQLYQGQPGTSAATLYTAPASDANVPSPYATAILNEIVLCNTTSSAATITLYVVPSGGTAGAATAIISGFSVAAKDTVVLTGLRTAIPPSGTIQGVQGTANAITVTISGAEVQ
ncbi:MAG: hypothetical protein K6V97_03780 [Actinomycetia bacterium]|nr:hypothetical protein [Actinomycetes bacterium]